METVQAPRAGAPAGYALGLVRHRWNRWAQAPDLFEHGGGGFGFLTDLWWAPQLGIGVAVLTNSQDHQLQNALSISILTDVVSELRPYRDRLAALPSRLGAEDPPLSFTPPASMANLVTRAAMVPTRDKATRWATYTGAYRLRAWGTSGQRAHRPGSSSRPASRTSRSKTKLLIRSASYVKMIWPPAAFS